LQVAYDHFNAELFEGMLVDVFITYQRQAHSRGYFSPNRFSGRIDECGRHELALNPDHFIDRSDEEIASTLVHEMTQLAGVVRQPGNSQKPSRYRLRQFWQCGRGDTRPQRLPVPTKGSPGFYVQKRRTRARIRSPNRSVTPFWPGARASLGRIPRRVACGGAVAFHEHRRPRSGELLVRETASRRVKWHTTRSTASNS